MSFKHNTWSKPQKPDIDGAATKQKELLFRHYRRRQHMLHAGQANVFSVGTARGSGSVLVGGR